MNSRILKALLVITAGSVFFTGCGVTVNTNNGSTDAQDTIQEEVADTESNEATEEEIATIANPVVSIEDDAEYEKQLGIKWDTSYIPAEVSRSIIGGKVAQAVFAVENVDGDEVEITLRGTKDEELAANPVELLAGIYSSNLSAPVPVNVAVDDGDIVFTKVSDKENNIDISYWTYDGVNYTVSDDGDLSQMELAEIGDSIMAVIGAVKVAPVEVKELTNNTGKITGKILEPLEDSLDVTSLAGTYSCEIKSLVESDQDGLLVGTFDIYTMDLYDAVDVSLLTKGDGIRVNGKVIAIDSCVQGDAVDMSLVYPGTQGMQATYIINGGYEKGGLRLIAFEGGTCRIFDEDQCSTYTYRGETSMFVNNGAIIEDSSNNPNSYLQPENNEYYDAKSLSTYFGYEKSMVPGFMPYNTTITVEQDKVVAIDRAYVPFRWME